MSTTSVGVIRKPTWKQNRVQACIDAAIGSVTPSLLHDASDAVPGRNNFWQFRGRKVIQDAQERRTDSKVVSQAVEKERSLGSKTAGARAQPQQSQRQLRNLFSLSSGQKVSGGDQNEMKERAKERLLDLDVLLFPHQETLSRLTSFCL